MTITSGPAAPAPARLRPGDLAGLASVGLRTRKLRAALSALGIAIGVAAIVAVLGLASSSQAGLLAEIGRLGTNLLTVTNGQSFTGQPAELPDAAPGMIGQLPGVTAVQYTGTVSSANVYRSPLIPSIDTDALTVDAASLGLPAVAGTSVAQGSYLNAATAREPVAVLGAEAAQLMGIDRIWPGERIWVGGMWFYLAGILNPATLAPQIDTSVLVGFPAAERYLGFDGHPSEIYVRTVNTQAATTAVDNLLAAQANPENPERGQRLPALGRADRPGRRRGRLRHPVPRPGRGRAAGRRGRRGQHHDHLGAGTPPGDRAAPRAGRHQRPDPHPVPGRGHPARPGRRRRRGHRRRRRHRRLRPRQGLGRSSSRPRRGPAASAPPSSSAPSPDSCPPSAPPACHPRRHSGPSDSRSRADYAAAVGRLTRPVNPGRRRCRC